MKIKILISIHLGLFMIIPLLTSAQDNDSSKMSSLIVYGDDFMFSVKEPNGWISDIDNAKNYYCNILFYQHKDDLKNNGTIIQVYNFKKHDEKTEKDLQYDIDSYKKDYKKLKQEDFKVSQQEYTCFSKLVYVENDFYQYLVYVNPGPTFKSGLSVSMNISNRSATKEELNAFLEIIASLKMLKG